MQLSKRGTRVEAVCVSHNPLRATSAVSRLHSLSGLSPISALRSAIEAAKPDLIIPGDDPATLHLHRLFKQEQARGNAQSNQLCRLIERSLGRSDSFDVVYARTSLLDLAAGEGVCVPRGTIVPDLDALCKWFDGAQFPIVLKANGTSGGDGVRIVQSPGEAEAAFQRLQAPPMLARAIKRTLMNHDSSLIVPSLQRKQYVVNVQQFIEGREATSAMMCDQGRVLAQTQFEVVQRQDARGPSTVLRRIENTEMTQAAEKIAARLNLSGVHGFDFMIENKTGKAYLLEMNPRATQVCHLCFGEGKDIPSAIIAALTGKRKEADEVTTDKDLIALFPAEWVRDPASAYLRTAYLDIPWEEPELVKASVARMKKRGVIPTAQGAQD